MIDKMKSYGILFVDDVENILESYDVLFEDFKQYNRLFARNGMEGIDMYKKFSPELVITDNIMPKKDGLEMSTDIKNISKEKNKPVYILMVSSLEDWNRLKLSARFHGQVDGTMIKPFDIDKLTNRVTKELERFK